MHISILIIIPNVTLIYFICVVMADSLLCQSQLKSLSVSLFECAAFKKEDRKKVKKIGNSVHPSNI